MDKKFLFFIFWLLGVSKIASLMVMNDTDLWGHVLYGLEHLASGSLALTDTYNYTAAGARWVNHEWLAELIFAYLWKHFGALGLWGIRTVVVGCVLALILKLVFENTQGVWAGILVFVPCWQIVARGFAVRPQIFSYLLFTFVLFLSQKIYVERQWRKSWLLSLIVIMPLWANFHGGFLIGVGTLGLLIIHELLVWRKNGASATGSILPISILLLSIACVSINPYGFELLKWIVNSLSIPRTTRLTEWAPVHAYHNQLALIGFYLTLPLLLLTIMKWRTAVFYEWGLLFSLGFLGWMNNRNTVFFALAAAVVLPKYLESTFPRLGPIPTFNRAFKYAMLSLSVAFAIGIHTVQGHRPVEIIVETSKHPYNAIKFIKKNQLEGNLLAYFDWSQMALWYLHDSCKIAFDGRFRTVYPPSVINDYFQFVSLGQQWQNMLYRYKTQIVLMPDNWVGTRLLKEDKNWLLAYQSDPGGNDGASLERALIFVRKNTFPRLEKQLEQGDLFTVSQQSIFPFGGKIW